LSGNPPENAKTHPGTISLGYLDDQHLPALVNAIDVACIVTRNSKFGKYSYPVKLCEAIACGTKVVATDTAPVRWMLSNDESALVPVDNPKAFSLKILERLESNNVKVNNPQSWDVSAEKLDLLLRD
jgi:glycosyltransferase involved in cell wall biosynthesis